MAFFFVKRTIRYHTYLKQPKKETFKKPSNNLGKYPYNYVKLIIGPFFVCFIRINSSFKVHTHTRSYIYFLHTLSFFSLELKVVQ